MARRTKPGYTEARHPDKILAQFRRCVEEAEEQKEAGYWDLVNMHLQHAVDSMVDLDNLLHDNKSAPLPADWQRD